MVCKVCYDFLRAYLLMFFLCFLMLLYFSAVVYSTENFLDKNKDYVVSEHAALLAASQSHLVATLFGVKVRGATKYSHKCQ